MVLKTFLYNIFFVSISLTSVLFFWNNPLLLAATLIIVSISMLLVWRSKEDFLLYIICGAWGAIAESIAIYFGVWTYSFPNFIGIPYWLPLLWGITALSVKRTSFEIHGFLKKKK